MLHPSLRLPIEEIRELCRRYRVRELAVFGSALREDFRPDSDVDLLVEFEPEVDEGLTELFRLQDEVESVLGRKVDLIPKSGLKPLIRDEVLESAVVLYGPGGPTGAELPGSERPLAPPMDPRKRDRLHLHEIVEAAKAIEHYTEGHDADALASDRLLGGALLHQLTAIGRAAARVSEGTRAAHEEVEWERLAGWEKDFMRPDSEIDWGAVWGFVTLDVPVLRRQAAGILAAEFPEGSHTAGAAC